MIYSHLAIAAKDSLIVCEVRMSYMNKNVLVTIFAVFLFVSCTLLTGCFGDGTKTTAGKEISRPEVSVKIGSNPAGIKLPEVSYIKWEFKENKEKNKTDCILKMKIKYNQTAKCVGVVSLLDANGFVVVSEKIDFKAVEGKSEECFLIVHLDEKSSKRVTKAKLEIESAI